MRTDAPLLAVLAVLSAGCAGSAMPPTAVFSLPDTAFTTWQQVLDEGVRVELTTMETGRQQYLLKDAAPDVEGERRKEPVEIQVLAHLIEHPDQGAWLVDTGLGAAFADAPYGDIRGLGARVALEPFEQEPGEALGDQLTVLGVNPVGVFFTHLHLDHTAGVPDLSGDLRYVAGAGETPSSVPGLAVHDHLAEVELLELLGWSDLPSVDGWPAADVLGDGSLWALPSPGHSPGHLSWLVLTDGGLVLLTGDAAHVRINWDESLAPGFSDDPEQAASSLIELRSLWAELGEPALIFGHEG